MKRGRGYAAVILAWTAAVLLPSASPFQHTIRRYHHLHRYPMTQRGDFLGRGGCFLTPFHNNNRGTTVVQRKPVGVASSTASTTAAPATSSFSPNTAGVDDPHQPQQHAVKRRREERQALIRKEGGRLAFDTKYGALNPFAIYYGLTSIVLGIPWFMVLTLYQLFQIVTFSRFDPRRRIPIFFTHCWGITLMRLTRCYPKIENMDVLKQFYKSHRPAMFVANHNSWLDIPFLGATIGWRNYKMISKKELGRVPILGKAIKVGGNVMVDRTNRRSQLETLKRGISYLKDGVHLCTYPEGTRSRTGRLTEFKNGAFKMAHKAGAPVVPISIVGAAQVMPNHWMFPYRPARGVATVIVHAPVESVGKTEEELAAEVRRRMISGLPEDQRPVGTN